MDAANPQAIVGATGTDGLIACPVCDALLRDTPVPVGARSRGAAITVWQRVQRALTRIVMLASTAFVLMWAAVFFPFL
jgi:paraquat-inducible protein A